VTDADVADRRQTKIEDLQLRERRQRGQLVVGDLRAVQIDLDHGTSPRHDVHLELAAQASDEGLGFVLGRRGSVGDDRSLGAADREQKSAGGRRIEREFHRGPVTGADVGRPVRAARALPPTGGRSKSGFRATLSPAVESTPLEFSGEIRAVKGRIKLNRSFDEVSHGYEGYTLLMHGTVGGEARELYRVGVGPAAHAKHAFRIGDRLTGRAVPVADPTKEWAELYRVSALKFAARGPDSEQRPADPEGGLPPPLPVYRAGGHRPLEAETCATACFRCPFGLTMATEITLDHRSRGSTWRFETHCYGPKDCPRFRAGPPPTVP
jgi:hypothetical protein